ncbi:MAG: NADH-quinone oxidoreductase subunit L [Anaerolineales bacterium]
MILSEATTSGGLFSLAPLLIGFPLLGLLLNIVFGGRLRERVIGIIASSAVGLAFVIAVVQFIALQSAPAGGRVMIADWITIGELTIPWAIKVDSLSVTMMLMVTGVSSLIHIYAIGYMHDDVRFQGDPSRFRRFFVYFNLFVAAMMILITADNYLMMFVGWEGVGLCSYLLISFWFEKGADGIGNAIAGKKAFIVNRIGDFGFLIAMFLVFWTFGTLQFDQVFHEAEQMGPAVGGTVTLITLFLLVGVTGKSAQLPLYVWLPDAMAGPTPVSALIHAATMVTAGIYLITRNHVLFDMAPSSANAVAWVGALTAFFAATVAVAQFDIKKVLAYSTISQLGFMVAAVGVGGYVAGMFHLVTHAFFKALLFLSAGAVIQGVEHGHHHVEHDHGDHGGDPFDPQDMRNMGGLRKQMPITFVVYTIGALALAGIPPLAGFFSKDEILLDASQSHPVVYALLAAAAFLTAFYMGRQIWMVFFGDNRSAPAEHAQERPAVVTVPLMALATLAVVGGGLNLPGVHSLTLWLEHTIEHLHVAEFSLQVAGISTAIALTAVGVAWWFYGRRTLAKGEADPLRSRLGPIFTGMEHKWWVDEAYQAVFVRGYDWAASQLAFTIDWRFWHDWFHDRVLASAFRGGSSWLAFGFDLPVIDGIVNGAAHLLRRGARRLGDVETGYVRNYALSLLVGTILVLSYLLLR